MLKLIPRMLKLFATLSLNLHDYFDGSIKLFSDPYLAKFLHLYFNKTILSMRDSM